MASAETRTREHETRPSKDPVHHAGPDEISQVKDGLELNPKNQHPPNAETKGVWKILRVSTVAAIAAMVLVGVVAFMAFG